MTSDEVAARKMANKYIQLIISFIDHKIPTEQFESSYLDLFKHDEEQVAGAEFDILEKLFFAVDDYVVDPELRSRVGGLGDEELRDRAQEAYRKLHSS